MNYSYVLNLLLLQVIREFDDDNPWLCTKDFCYSAVTKFGSSTFDVASEKCSKYNASLASVHSDAEHVFIENIRNRYLAHIPVWLGMRRTDYLVEWIDGTPLDFYAKYHEISNPSSCVYLFSDWYEDNCDSTFYFICKRKVEKESKDITQTSSLPEQARTDTVDVNIQSSFACTSIFSEQYPTETMTNTASCSSLTSTYMYYETFVECIDSTYRVTRSGYPQTSTSTVLLASPTTVPNLYQIRPTTAKSTRNVNSIRKKPFEEVLQGLRVKKQKVVAKEAPGSRAIGAVSLFILITIVFGIVLLDLGTIREHLKLLLTNIRYIRE